MMSRANWIGAPQFFELNAACRVVAEAYGQCLYLVGSALETRDFRDVDIRGIVDDDEFDQMFPGIDADTPQYSARWSLLCSAISLWLTKHSGLPVDFQFQRQTNCNEQYKGKRHAVGLFFTGEQTDDWSCGRQTVKPAASTERGPMSAEEAVRRASSGEVVRWRGMTISCPSASTDPLTAAFEANRPAYIQSLNDELAAACAEAQARWVELSTKMEKTLRGHFIVRAPDDHDEVNAWLLNALNTALTLRP